MINPENCHTEGEPDIYCIPRLTGDYGNIRRGGWRVIKRTIVIKYFAHLAGITNVTEESLQFDSEITLYELLKTIRNKYKDFAAENDTFLVALNDIFIPVSVYESTSLEDGDAVALFPPVSGG